MKFKTSYFYQIRFFKENQIPLSTAKWDPLWFHKNTRDYSLSFRDKRNVINGLRIDSLAPGKECDNLCRGRDECNTDPNNCLFLQKYSEQLNKIDIKDLLSDIENILISHDIEITDDTEIIFIVYETPENKCSERQTIINYFKSNNIDIAEFERE